MPQVYLDLLGRFERLFDRPAPYISAWHQAPVRGRPGRVRRCIWSCSRSAGPSDKLKYLAGSESGMDAFANDVSPETAAEALRSA